MSRTQQRERRRERILAREKASFIYSQNQQRGKVISPFVPRSLARQELKERAELYVRMKGYLRQDLGIKGVSSKALALLVTRPNREEMPFEHLTFRRLKDC